MEKNPTFNLSPKKLQNHTKNSNLNSRSASTHCVADQAGFLGYKSLPSSIQHGLSEKILHNLSDKLEKLLPSGGHVNHHGQSGFNSVTKNPCHQVDPTTENVQRSNSLSLGQTLSPSHVNSSPNGKNVISEVGQAIKKSQCQETISPEKHSLASPDDKRGSQDASFHCKNVKGMLNFGGKDI